MAHHDRLRVAVVGGMTRASDLWMRAGDALGVDLEHHDGQTSGRGSGEIAAAVRRAHVVVIITEPNSHSGVAVARRVAISAARPHVLVKRLRPGGLGELLSQQLARKLKP